MSGKRLKVLLVEDSEEDAFFFRRTLARTGLSVDLRVVSDGRQAVDLLAKKDNLSRPDVIFLDLKLPLLSGFDVLRWALEQQISPPLPIIVLSGSAHEKDQVLAAELGAVEYLVKPVSVEKLGNCLAQFAMSDERLSQ
jgi:DNA-binding response OmpR family regulator